MPAVGEPCHCRWLVPSPRQPRVAAVSPVGLAGSTDAKAVRRGRFCFAFAIFSSALRASFAGLPRPLGNFAPRRRRLSSASCRHRGPPPGGDRCRPPFSSHSRPNALPARRTRFVLPAPACAWTIFLVAYGDVLRHACPHVGQNLVNVYLCLLRTQAKHS